MAVSFRGLKLLEKKGIFVKVTFSGNLPERKMLQVSGETEGGLNKRGYGYCNQSMHNLVKH
jgi:hypothetical protein